jgi:hypothetical protein
MSYFMEEFNTNDSSELELIIRRQHAHKRFLRTQAQMLRQELDLEDELLEQYPEMAGFIHQLNTAEIAAQQKGVEAQYSELQQGRITRFINRLFPGID